jgi:hypothetical protein
MPDVTRVTRTIAARARGEHSTEAESEGESDASG